MTLLSDVRIRDHMAHGSVVIDPFRVERLNTDSYDLELGPFFWRYTRTLSRRPADMARGEGFELVDARDEAGIWLAGGERVLGHSVEIVGGREAREYRGDGFVESHWAVTSGLSATSTAGRHGLTVCECAGWGDVGFVNIFVFELQNKLMDRMWLPVGALIAQIHFDEVTPPEGGSYAQRGGHTYAPASTREVAAGPRKPVYEAVTPDEIRAAWRPEDMLPKALKTRETWREQDWNTNDNDKDATT